MITTEILAHSLSISRQTHKRIPVIAFKTPANKQERTICYRIGQQIDISFSCFCPAIDNKPHQNPVKVVCRSLSYRLTDPQLLDKITKFMINNRTDT